MKLNSFLALGIVLVLFGSALQMTFYIIPGGGNGDSVDTTAPQIYSTQPFNGYKASSLKKIYVRCRDLESGIKKVTFAYYKEGQTSLRGIVTYVNLEFQGIIYFPRLSDKWEIWTYNLDPDLSELGIYTFQFIVYNNAELYTVKPIVEGTSKFTIESITTVPTGSLEVIGYYDAEPISCEVWHIFKGEESQHRQITAEGYIWPNIEIGDYEIHGIYNDISATDQTYIAEGEITTVLLSFGGSPVPPTQPSKPFDEDTASTFSTIFIIGGVACIAYGIIKKRKRLKI